MSITKASIPQSIYNYNSAIEHDIQKQESMDNDRMASVQENQRRVEEEKERERAFEEIKYRKSRLDNKGRECESLFSQINDNLDQLDLIGKLVQCE